MYKTSFPNVFEVSTVETMKSRINKLSADTVPQWGKMNAGQMLAHLNVAYDIAYGKIPMKYNFFMRFMFKQFLTPIVIGDKPYDKNSRTAPVFLMEGEKDFEVEKAKLIGYIEKMAREGSDKFEGKESASFGKLTSEQWSRQFAKHFEHHCTQFGV
ncbi:MAG: DUF1569 domain-containing protein [Saprospiraceae bacterium]